MRMRIRAGCECETDANTRDANMRNANMRNAIVRETRTRERDVNVGEDANRHNLTHLSDHDSDTRISTHPNATAA